MSVITFVSDFGTEDHYVAAVKAAIIRDNPDCRIIDITHQIGQSDIAHAAYVLKNVYREFPEQSVHMCAVDQGGRELPRQIAVQWNNHFFLGPDNGLFSLIGDLENGKIVEIVSKDEKADAPSTFTARDILAPAAAKLLKDRKIEALGPSSGALKRLFARQLKVTKREIAGNVIRVDHYGNLITNINRKEFETIIKLNGNSRFQIQFGRETIGKIHASYHEVESGECYVIFNSNDNIQIGINQGNASELLGIFLDTTINIFFDT